MTIAGQPDAGAAVGETPPAVIPQTTACPGAPKTLIDKEGFIPPHEISCGGVKLEKPVERLPLIIGFDAEWVEEPEEPSDDPDADDPLDPDALPRNLVLSYQYACRFEGHEWSGIVYTRAGAKLRFPALSEEELAVHPDRIRFADLLGDASTLNTWTGY